MNGHQHHHEPMPEDSGPGTVVLDIGGEIGAAAVSAPEGLVGAELEIRRGGTTWDGTHIAVRRRLLAGSPVTAALFPELTAGDYEVRVKGDPASAIRTFAVVGGEVTATTYP